MKWLGCDIVVNDYEARGAEKQPESLAVFATVFELCPHYQYNTIHNIYTHTSCNIIFSSPCVSTDLFEWLLNLDSKVPIFQHRAIFAGHMMIMIAWLMILRTDGFKSDSSSSPQTPW